MSFLGASFLSFPIVFSSLIRFFLIMEAVSFLIPCVPPVASLCPALVAISGSQLTCQHHTTYPVYRVAIIMVILEASGPSSVAVKGRLALR